MAGEVVDLLDRDAEVEHSCDEGVAEIVGAFMAKASAVALIAGPTVVCTWLESAPMEATAM